MKKLHYILLAVLFTVSACHEPQYVESTADRQGLTSLAAMMIDGPYANQELGRLTVTDPDATRYEIPIPFYYPEASNNETLMTMLAVRVQAELQPNWKISPKLGVLDLTEEHAFTLTDPKGDTRDIVITGKRVKSAACSLLSVMVEEVKTSGAIYEAQEKVLIPYLEDLSAVRITGQVSAHAKIIEVNGKKYSDKTKYNLNSSSTITIQAHDGTTTKTYTIEKGIPTLMSQGLRKESVSLLCNVDPVSVSGLPAYNQLAYVSLAGIGPKIVVGLGEGRAPVIVDAFTGSKTGTLPLGAAVADCLTNDDAGHILIANYAEGGMAAQDVNIYVTSSLTDAPTLFHSFTNPLAFPIGHRIKVMGDIAGDAVIVFTSEGIAGISTSSTFCWLNVSDGAVVGEAQTMDLAAYGMGWGAAPVNFATVVPASVTPEQDGWFVDYYEGNVDPSITDSTADCYILHYINGSTNKTVELMGNWAINPNCLDLKTFNGSRFLALFGVSHFPEWDIRPRLHLFDVTDPESASVLLKKDNVSIFQKDVTDPEVGAAGDVVLCPTKDGYRVYLYYYDHHAQAIGAYVADCFEI